MSTMVPAFLNPFPGNNLFYPITLIQENQNSHEWIKMNIEQ